MTDTLTYTTIESSSNRPAGSIGSAFASLSNGAVNLPPRFQQLKKDIVGKNAEAILSSWNRLLDHLSSTILPTIASQGGDLIPEISFNAIKASGNQLPKDIKLALKKAGSIIVRGMVSEEQALEWKQQVREYIAANPQTNGFPKGDIQVYELYWAKAQLAARSHKNMLMVQRALNEVWSSSSEDRVDLSTPVAYCDRLRIRQPGDGSFNLGPHLDGGSLERWEDLEYRKCYSTILQGKWEEYDAFNVSSRLGATYDMYNGPGGCSAFRSYQGWLSLSECGPGSGTLRVIPDLTISTAYIILRPLVRYNAAANCWEIDSESSIFHGAAMGTGQELDQKDHSHIYADAFVTMPTVRPGDAVFWHCDTAHMVEPYHGGTQDASVFYIPSAPLCDVNIEYLQRQRRNFLLGAPPPDFPGGIGEIHHLNCGLIDDLNEDGKRAMGCGVFQVPNNASPGQRAVVKSANVVLGPRGTS